MQVSVELDNASGDTEIPTRSQFEQWSSLALSATGPADAEQSCLLSIRVVDAEESAYLNQHYRHKAGPTNILSFPCEAQIPDQPPLLGDLAICAPVVRREAEAQGKPLQHHWAHLTVHGVLHLRGHDHEHSEQAAMMETIEIRVLQHLGIPDPYQ